MTSGSQDEQATPAELVAPDQAAHDQAAPDQAGPSAATGRRQVIIVTGLSGAGKQSVLRALEDLSFEAIDNMPLEFWAQALSSPEADEQAGAPKHPLALGLDVRTRGFAPDAVLDIVSIMRSLPNLQVTLLFLDADDDVLQRRFNETRRRHPLAPDRPLGDGIGQERHLLAELRDKADLVIDTSRTGIPDLRHMVASRVVGLSQGDLALHFISFAYKDGLPRSADLVFDVRFLRNPHYDPELRAQTGRDPAVQRYVRQDEDFKAYFKRLTDLLALSLRRYGQEGKSYLTVAVGCSGGKHRSVFMAESLADWALKKGHRVSLRHQVLGHFTKFEPLGDVVKAPGTDAKDENAKRAGASGSSHAA